MRNSHPVTTIVHLLVFLLVFLLGFAEGSLAGAEKPTEKPTVTRPDQTDLPANFLFDRYTVQDCHQRTITFYLSRLPKSANTEMPRPVVLFVNGSGCQSVFMKVGDKISVGLAGLMYSVLDGKARVVVVEKPGVKFLDLPEQPGTAMGASDEFLREHTLDRWVNANHAALQGAWTLPGIDPKRTLAVGHSEGAGVVARLARKEPSITQVACLSGGGPPQLFDLVELAGRQAKKTGADVKLAREKVYTDWAAVLADPESVTKMWMGHPYRRWSTFASASQTDDLLKSKAQIFLAHGSDDIAVPVTSFDVCVATLRASNRAITWERVEGGDHGFGKAGDTTGEGFRMILTKVAKWFTA